MPKGMMLAAGLGTRMGALTAHLPKPLMPIANEPVMAHGLRCLRRLGLTEVCANVCHLREQVVETFGDGGAHGLRIRWLLEDEPSGTAGGMKGMQRFLEDDLIVVLAGDTMLDIDLTPLLEGHRAVGAFASLATLHVEDPSRYGVVVTDVDGRVLRFQEKPRPGTEISRQANTGIYVLDPGIFDLIPRGKFCDFALHVFPEILRRGLPFFAFPVGGYWTDIGHPGAYLQANLDFLAGRIRAQRRGQRLAGSLVGDDVATEGRTFTNCVVGDRAKFAPGTELQDCVVWAGTHLAAPVSASSAVLTPWGCYRIVGSAAEEMALARAR